MCGICGIVATEGAAEVERATLEKMNHQIRHRGPDDEGYFIDRNVGLAMRRLSIIDVASGHQPIANEDESVWLVFNGEIYNHAEMRARTKALGHTYRTRSDTETIVHLYEEYGADSIQHLRGMFAFAIWDRRKERVLLARDRLGIKPLYYRWDGRTLVFGSEIKALLAYSGMKPHFEERVLAEYLAFGYVSGSRTMFAGIRKLLPGHTLELSARGGEPLIKCYWDLGDKASCSAQIGQDWSMAYRERLEDSVKSHLMSDVPLGVFLSGGIDSSVIAAMATKARGEPIQTFSVGYEEEPFSELTYARAVAKHLRSEHYEVKLTRDEFFQSLPMLIWHEDEPLAWPSSVALYFVARLAREHVKVVLTGEGSDETLAGYGRYAWTLLNTRLDGIYRHLVPAEIRRWLRRALKDGFMPPVLARKLGHTFLGRNGESWTSLYFDNFYSAFSSTDQSSLLSDSARAGVDDAYAWALRYWERAPGGLLQAMLYTDAKTYLQELLMKQDQMSMAASIESRVPFLDHPLVEFAATIPQSELVRGTSGKHVLKSIAVDLLPREIVYRKKAGFPTPWEGWIRTPEQLDRLAGILLDSRSIERGYFKTEALVSLFDEQRRGSRNHRDRLWRLLNLELWHRVFIDQESFVQI